MSRVALALFLLLASCRDNERCRAWAGTQGRSEFFQCGDQKARLVQCGKASKAGTCTCTCSCDGVAEKSFETTDLSTFDTRDTAIALANTQCGWQLTK
jgi:hypothetical protein